MPKRTTILYRRLLALLLLPVTAAAFASSSPAPFDARYHLEVNGWPDADIQHQLSETASGWQSEMSARLPGISGEEAGRFRLSGNQLQSYYYASRYSLLGVKKSYQLGTDDLQQGLDRQSALFALSRQAINSDCRAACRIEYLDHRGREESVEYRILGRQSLSVPAGRFEALRVEVTEPDDDDSRLVFDFLPRLPGLLLSMTYYSDGKRKSRLELTSLQTP